MTLSKLGSPSRSRSYTAQRLPKATIEELVTDERRRVSGEWPLSWQESGSPGGGGMNNNWNSGSGGGGAYRFEIGAYYQQMPEQLSALGKISQILAREEYYGRAIFASPGDGEVLSLYGKLIWETQRDEKGALSYFNQALQASPQDSMILGSYARFLWEADEEQDEDEKEGKTDENTSEGPIQQPRKLSDTHLMTYILFGDAYILCNLF